MENLADIVDLAIANEVRARRFYADAAGITDQGESQMIFLELADMEESHARLLVDRFGGLLRARGVDPETRLERLEAEAAAGLGGAEGELVRSGDMRAVVEFAIGLEIKARDGYRELAARLEDREQKRFCEHLAIQEQHHHDALSDLRISMDTPPEERPAL